VLTVVSTVTEGFLDLASRFSSCGLTLGDCFRVSSADSVDLSLE
jgi:hypothetical protein